MLRLTSEQRALLADKFAELANLAVAALVFGQALGSSEWSIMVAVLGVTLWALLTGIAIVLTGGTP